MVFRISVDKRTRHRLLAFLFLVFLVVLSVSAELIRQGVAIRYGRVDCGANLHITNQNGQTSDGRYIGNGVSFVGKAVFRGPFVVAEYRIERTVLDNEGHYIWVPAKIDAGSTVVDIIPAIPRYIKDVVPAVSGYHPDDRTHFIGQVSIRRGILWTSLGVLVAAMLWLCIRLFVVHRRLRRYARNRCTRCNYPLPIDEDDPRCPECGTLHTS